VVPFGVVVGTVVVVVTEVVFVVPSLVTMTQWLPEHQHPDKFR